MKRFPSITNLKVSARISLGFAIVLVLHLSIAFLSHYGLMRADRNRETQEQLRARVEIFHQIDQTVDELQRNVLLFAYGGFKGPETRVLELQTQLRETLESARQSDTQLNQKALREMEGHLERHREIFDTVIADRAKRRELVDSQLLETGQRFSNELEKLNQHGPRLKAQLRPAAEAFTSAQLQVMMFVHNPDSRYARETEHFLSKARMTIRELQQQNPIAGADLNGLLTILDDYQQQSIQMVQVTRGYLHLVNVVMAGESQELSYLAETVRRHDSEQASQLSLTIEKDSNAFSFASSLFSILTIALGIAASWFIQRSISSPLNQITRTFDDLATGRDCPTIPGTDRGDELGRLAIAAQVFRDKAKQTEELLHEVSRMRELERNHAHSQKLESLGQMASGIAHEINTPLQCVAANVEFLEDSQAILLDVIDECCHWLDMPELCDEAKIDEVRRDATRLAELRAKVASRGFHLAKTEGPQAANDAGDAVRRVVDIISAMKSFSHPDTERWTQTDLNQLIQGACKLSRHRWKDYAELELDLADDLPMVDVQPAEISQVLINLLVNAGDAIETHRGANSASGRIRVTSREDENGLRVEVSDNGGGVPESIRSRIFDPFFTTKEVGKGTGQGLSLVYDVLVRRHKGRIELETDSQGTRFVITLPTRPSRMVTTAGC